MIHHQAVILDIDGTLTDNVSWTTLTERLGASKEVHEHIFKRFLNKELSYIDAKKQLIELWYSTGNAHRTFISDLLLIV